jgi:hypothetical protein
MAAKTFLVPFASGGDRTPAIPDAQQSDGSVSYTTGYGPDYEKQLGVDPDAKNIDRDSYNSLLYDITVALNEMQAGVGAQPFNATFAASLPGGGYAVGAIIPQSSGLGVWVNLTAHNTTNPDAGGAGWVAISARVDYAVGAGTANAQTATYVPALPTTDGTVAKFKAIATNTGPTTFNGSPVLGGAGLPLQGGEIVSGGIVTLVRLSGSWIIVASSGGALQVPTPTKSQQAVTYGQLKGQLIKSTVVSASGTFTFDSTLPIGSLFRLRGVGGGGAGGGSAATSTGNLAAGAGGTSGSYAEGWFTKTAPTAAVVIGGGGVPAAGNATGGNGGVSSFGSYMSCPGGAGGSGSSQAVNTSPRISAANAGSGTLPTGGNVVAIGGEAGDNGICLNGSQGGNGGSNPLGAGGNSPVATGGRDGSGYGAGGSGGNSPSNTAASQAGGAGAPGVFIVDEYL